MPAMPELLRVRAPNGCIQQPATKGFSMSNNSECGSAAMLGSDAYPSPLERVIIGTIKLHRLIEEGNGESEEADDVRDSLDAPLRELTSSQGRVARLLSAAIQDRCWIPVGDRLPPESITVIAYPDYMGERRMAWHVGGKWNWIGVHEHRKQRPKPTHWMQMPDKPTGVQ